MGRNHIHALALISGLSFPILTCTAPEPPAVQEPGSAELPAFPEHRTEGRYAPEPPAAGESVKLTAPTGVRPQKIPERPEPETRAPIVGESLPEPAADPAEPAETTATSSDDEIIEDDDGEPPADPIRAEQGTGTFILAVNTCLSGSRLTELERQNKELTERLKKLEDRIDGLEDEVRHQTLGFGFGLAAGLNKAGGEYRLVLETNLRYLFSCLYVNTSASFCAGLAANLRLWNVQLRWIGVGVMYYFGDRALSVPEFERRLDLMLTSGLDVRIWKGLELRAQVAWFIPPPGPIFDKAKKHMEKAVDEFDVEKPGRIKKAPKEAWGIVTDAYERAFASPYLVIGVRWEF